MSVRIYECVRCGARALAQGYPGRCSTCGGHMVNISRQRE